MSRLTTVAALVATAIVLAAVPARALDILTDDERAEKEREAKLKAKPVLVCIPASFSVEAKRGETAELTLTVKNSGGQTLRWSLGRLPRWFAADATTGELKHMEERKVVIHVRTRLITAAEVESSLVVEAPGADGSPVTVPVALKIEPGDEPEDGTADGVDTTGTGFGEDDTSSADVPDGPFPPDGGGPTRGGIGVRLGFMLPAGGADSYASSPIFGVHYRLAKEASKLSYEFGIDLTGSDAEAAASSSGLTTTRADVLYTFPRGESNLGWYLLSGFGGLFESAAQDDKSGSFKVGLLDLGAGLEIADGKVDVRFSHARLIGSNNVGGMTQVSVAYCF